VPVVIFKEIIMKAVTKKNKSIFEYLIVILLIVIVAVFAYRIIHILKASFGKGNQASQTVSKCPMKGGGNPQDKLEGEK